MACRIAEEEYEVILAKEKQSEDPHASQRLQILRLYHAADSHSEMTEQPDTMDSETQSAIFQKIHKCLNIGFCLSPKVHRKHTSLQ